MRLQSIHPPTPSRARLERTIAAIVRPEFDAHCSGPDFDPNSDPKFDPVSGSNCDPEFDPNFDPGSGPDFDPDFDPVSGPNCDPDCDPEFDPLQPSILPLQHCHCSSSLQSGK